MKPKPGENFLSKYNVKIALLGPSLPSIFKNQFSPVGIYDGCEEEKEHGETIFTSEILRPPPSPLSLHCKDRKFSPDFDSIPRIIIIPIIIPLWWSVDDSDHFTFPYWREIFWDSNLNSTCYLSPMSWVTLCNRMNQYHETIQFPRFLELTQVTGFVKIQLF